MANDNKGGETPPTSIRIPSALLRALDATGAGDELREYNRSAAIREAIAQYIETVTAEKEGEK